MKLEDPIELASCGPMEFGRQIGRRASGHHITTNSNSTTNNNNNDMKQPREDARLDKSEQSHTAAHKASHLPGDEDRDKRLASVVASQDHRQAARLGSDKRPMEPALLQQTTARRRPRKHRRHHWQQQAQDMFAAAGGRNAASLRPNTNLLLQDHIKNMGNRLAAATPASNINTITNSNGRVPATTNASSTGTSASLAPNTNQIHGPITAAAGLASSMGVEGLLSECFRQQETNDEQQQQLRLAGIEFMAAQAVRQQHQRSQEILEQFASLHNLSAVATAIQQSHHHHQHHPHERLATNQTSSFIAHHQTISHHHSQHQHQFELAQLQHHSQQLQFSLANLTLSHQSASVPSSGLTSSSGVQSMPIDLHRMRQVNGADAVAPSVAENPTQPTLMDMMRDSLMSRLAPAALQQQGCGGQTTQPTASFVHFAANQKVTTTGSLALGGLQHQRASGSGIRIGRRRGARKCRKIYGMAQRQLWCTQCKWKKACSRFFGASQTAAAANTAPLGHASSSRPSNQLWAT